MSQRDPRLCKAIAHSGNPCNAYATEDSDYCWFHGGGVKTKRGLQVEMSRAIITRKNDTGFSYRKLFGGRIAERPRHQKLLELEKFYDDGGIIARAIDSYVAVAVSNKWQYIDAETGERETDNTKIVEELDARINFDECFKKTFLSLLIYGFVWGEMDIPRNSKKIERLMFLPPYELEIERDDKGHFKKFLQVRGTNKLSTWAGEKVKNIIYVPATIKHSETYGKGLLERVFNEANDWKEMGKDLSAVTKFISYPIRIVKVGSDTYPASKDAVDTVGDEVEQLQPGDWLATRHNLEFEFHAPDVPEAIMVHYRETTRLLIVSLGVPSLYTTLEDIDANTLKEIRDIFNSTIQAMQNQVAEYFEEFVIKRQFELLGKLKKKTDKAPVRIVFNPLTVSVLSILELTQLVTAGVLGIDETRAVLESMGYGIFRGDEWKKDILMPMAPLGGGPKESHPTDDDPNKPPIKPPTQAPDKPPTKPGAPAPTIKRPQPNQPVLSFEEWMIAVESLKEVDKNRAYRLLNSVLSLGYSNENI